jgi:hypothetical protein
MINPNTKNPPVLTQPVTVRLDEPTLAKLVEQCRRENVTLSHLVRRLIADNGNDENTKRVA